MLQKYTESVYEFNVNQTWKVKVTVPLGALLWSEWQEDADNTRHIKYWNMTKVK
jgi:hypothetical protein